MDEPNERVWFFDDERRSRFVAVGMAESDGLDGEPELDGESETELTTEAVSSGRTEADSGGTGISTTGKLSVDGATGAHTAGTGVAGSWLSCSGGLVVGCSAPKGCGSMERSPPERFGMQSTTGVVDVRV